MSGLTRKRELMLLAVLVALLLFVLSVIAFGDSAEYRADRLSDGEIEEICDDDQYGCVEYGIGDTVQLGGLLWVGDSEEQVGVDSQRGVELAVDYLDAQFDGIPGQVLGHTVEVVIADDGCSPEQGRAGAKNLADTRGLIGVVGTTCSGSALGAADKVLSSRGILLISPSNTAPELTEPFVGQRFYARTAPNDLIQGSVVADFARARDRANTAVVLHDGTPYSRSLAEVFAGRFEFLGGDADVRKIPGPSPKQVKKSVDSATSESPDILYFPIIPPYCELIVRELAELPGGKTEALTSDGCQSSEMLELSNNLGVEVLASGPDLSRVQTNSFYADQFLSGYRKRYGTSPTAPFHPQAFDAANLILDSMRRVAIPGRGGTLWVPRTALRNALREIDGYDGISGTIECRPTGDCAQSALIAVFKSPDWPVDGGPKDPNPVYSQSKTLSEVQSSS